MEEVTKIVANKGEIQMLAALLISFIGFMAVSGPDGIQFGELTAHQVKDEIKITISDKERRKDALRLLSLVKKDLKDINKQTSKDLKELEKLIQNYDSKPEDFDRLFASVLANRDRHVDKLWEDRQSMLQHIHPDEWQKILSGAKAEVEKKLAQKTKK